jgi:hypothetical protein
LQSLARRPRQFTIDIADLDELLKALVTPSTPSTGERPATACRRAGAAADL